MGQRVRVLLGASTGRAGRKSGCKHRKSTRAPLPERFFSKEGCVPSWCVTDGLSKQTQILSPSAHFNTQQACGLQEAAGSQVGPGLRPPCCRPS